MIAVRKWKPAVGLVALLFIGLPACTISILPAPGLDVNLPAADGVDPKNPAVERTTKTMAFDDAQTLRIQIPTGRVVVQLDGSATSLIVRVTKTILVGGKSPEEYSAMLTGSTVTADRSFIDANRFEIEAQPGRGLSNTDIAFDVQVTLPRSVPTEIMADNAPVEVTGLAANLKIRTANGKVKVSLVTGHVVAETSERPIEILDVNGNVSARTSNADATLRVNPSPGGFLAAETENGNIDLAVTVGTGAALKLDAKEGQVSADLSGFQVTGLSISDGLLMGVLNGGGGKVEATTRKGQIAFVAMDKPSGS